ncbi:NAD-dependent epimerase/dehydratase family protein [Sandarakinorhabdus sp. DWP1-3-1]|uniref:NAD-dependent epimerase/dehydratase family protein n=1 Tax=Sandarakinorhabdus sp. DWP1-3-1 TaxID=2804627 RepID=UPI003CE7B17C
MLVTGGAGFIGARLAQALVDRGDTVHLLVRPTTDLWRIAGLAGRAAVHVVADDSDLPRLLDAAAPEHVYHLAATTRAPAGPDMGDVADSLADLNRLMALVVAAARSRRPPRLLVRAGSLAEYGPGPAPFVESQREQPLTPYAAMLVAGTVNLAMLRPRLPFAAVTARLALVYGPGQSTQFLLPALIRNCLAGLPTFLDRPCDRRDLLFIDDAVTGLLRFGTAAGALPPVVNLATGKAPQMIEVASMVTEAVGASPALVGMGDPRPAGGVAYLCGSTALAADHLGWRARTDLPAGIAATVAAMGAAPTTRELAPC